MKAAKQYQNPEKKAQPDRTQETAREIEFYTPGAEPEGICRPAKERERAYSSGRERRALRLAKRWRRIALAGILAALVLGGLLLAVFLAGGGHSAGDDPGNRPDGTQAGTGTAQGQQVGGSTQGGGKGGNNPPVICIDPGHGFTKSSGALDVGCATGAYFDMTGKYEADLNLEIAQLLCRELEDRGCTVVMTRQKNEDKILEISDRPGYIDSFKPDLCISIHGNSFDGKVTGARVFVGEKRSDSEGFGGALVQAINDACREYPALTDPAASLKKDTTGIAILRAVSCPVALVETCFMDAGSDAAKAASPLWRAQMASALADGIQAYLSSGK